MFFDVGWDRDSEVNMISLLFNWKKLTVTRVS